MRLCIEMIDQAGESRRKNTGDQIKFVEVISGHNSGTRWDLELQLILRWLLCMGGPLIN